MKNRTVLCIGLFLSVWAYICLKIYVYNSVDYVVDERAFVHYGRQFFNLFFMDRDFFSETWLKSLNCFGSNNPKAGLFILGAVAEFWSFVSTNINFDFINEIIAQRCLNAVFSALTVLFSFLFISLFSKGVPRWVVVFLFLINPIFRAVEISLLPEVHMLFFIILSLFLLGKIGEDMGKASYVKLLILSFLIGLSVSSRLYGFSIYLTFLFVCLYSLKKYNKKDVFLRFAFVSFFGGCVFFLTNPSFYQGIFFGLKEMTVGHMNVLGYKPSVFKFLELKHLFTYPYVIFRLDSFHIASMHSYNDWLLMGDYFVVAIGYVLATRGFLYCISTAKHLPIFWFLASHFWLAYPFLVLGSAVLGPKALLLPMSSVVFLSSFAFSKK